MKYLIEPQTASNGMASTTCRCNCTINFGVGHSTGGGNKPCTAYCPKLVVCTTPGGIKVSPQNV